MIYDLRFKNVLLIDTSSNQIIKVGLRIDKKTDIIEQKIDKQKAQVVLPLIDKLLSKHKLKLAEITSIEVNIGPGSFTGLRVGIAIANALGFLLKVPINGGKIGVFVEPFY